MLCVRVQVGSQDIAAAWAGGVNGREVKMEGVCKMLLCKLVLIKLSKEAVDGFTKSFSPFMSRRLI